MRIGVLAVDLPRGKVGQVFGNYYHMFERAMKRVEPGLQLVIFPVLLEGKLPPLRQWHDFDGFYITGSRHGVYDNKNIAPWIEDLKDWVRLADDKKVKLYGTCFGHQVIADALGGKVEKNPKGIHLGLKPINLSPAGKHVLAPVNPALLSPTNTPQPTVPSAVNLLFMHSDHVVKVPQGMSSLGGNEHCEVLSMAKGDHIFTLQGHPECVPDVVRLKVAEKRGLGILTEEQAHNSLNSLTTPVLHSDYMSQQVHRFFKGKWHGLQGFVPSEQQQVLPKRQQRIDPALLPAFLSSPALNSTPALPASSPPLLQQQQQQQQQLPSAVATA